MTNRVNFSNHVVRFFERREAGHAQNVTVRHPNGVETFLGDVPLGDLDGRLVRVYRDYQLAEPV